MNISAHSHSGLVIFHVTLHTVPTSSVLWRLPELNEVATSVANAVRGQMYCCQVRRCIRPRVIDIELVGVFSISIQNNRPEPFVFM